MSHISVEDKGKYVVLRVMEGVFIREGVRELVEKVKELKAQAKTRFLLDFSACEYISSEGLGAMSDLWKFCHSQPNGKMAVLFAQDPQNEVRYLFESVGLASLMDGGVFDSPKDAEEYFS